MKENKYRGGMRNGEGGSVSCFGNITFKFEAQTEKETGLKGFIVIMRYLRLVWTEVLRTGGALTESLESEL